MTGARRRFTDAMIRLRRLLLGCLLTVVAASAFGGIEDAYFAPDGPTIFKVVLPDGAAYRFEYDVARPGSLVSGFGWSGVYDQEGHVRLSSPAGDLLSFDRGRLVKSRLGGVDSSFSYDTPRHAPTNAVTPLAMLLYDEKTVAENYVAREESVKWSNTGRLAFPYVNPNFSGALFALCALLLIGLALGPGRAKRPLRVCCLALSAALCALTAWSGSRGAMLGLFAGAATGLGFAILRRGMGARRILLCIVVAVVALAGVIVIALGHGNLMRGFGDDGGLTWSNALRVEMLKAAPRMMYDAPGGWSQFGIGKGFTYWYQPLGMILMSGSLINAHLTWLVGFGVVGRFVYVFFLFASLWLALRLAACERNVMPASVIVGFATIACFNPIFEEWGLWVVPAVAIVLVLASVRRITRKGVVVMLSLCALASATAVGTLMAVGASAQARPSIALDGRAVKVNGPRPRVWIVDDGQGVVGGVLVGRDIREYYANVRHAPAIGYVKNVRDLPDSGVVRLVLPGKSANDWLLMLSEDEKARENLPKSVLFLNPPFAPSEVPQGVLALCRPKLLVGEFAARYNPEYENPPQWVSIVPGMEKYIADWMVYALGE